MSKKQDNKLVLYKPNIVASKIGEIQKPKNSSTKTCTEITNAWSESVYYDDKGIIWVDSDRLHSILRTTKPNAKYEIELISKEYKNNKLVPNKVYIKGYIIESIIDKNIQKEKVGKRKGYLKYSENVYRDLRDSDEIELKRAEHLALIEEARKKLKSKRIKKYNINYDELTGKSLVRRSAEFAHIRSYAIYKHLANDVENGLIVNKETHKIITANNVNDENELFKLCEEMKWNTDWYTKYRNFFDLK